ncbi:MAG TPA: hypothetical protein VK465_14445, partial [Fibrobacteria bacterium]|nr:hypothetical protein [Fibrobacteria bacterium]
THAASRGMRMNAKSLPSSSAAYLVSLGLALSAAAQDRVCDKTYYMQSATQILLNGTTAEGVTPSSVNALNSGFSGIEKLHAEISYRLMTRFEGNGACADYKQTKVDFAARPKGQADFQTLATTTNYVRVNYYPYPSQFTAGIDADYWFGFASEMKGDTAKITETLVKLKGATRPVQWYGTAILTREVNASGTPIGTRIHYWRELFYSPDSAKLIENLLKEWKDFKTNDTQTVAFRVQVIKVVYDSVPATVRLRGSQARLRSGFEARQTGSQVLIQLGDRQADAGALGVFNMMGHQIATLHPTGYAYQWNGRTSVGAEAPTGVYFVQSGNRILGKFFFTR